MDTLANTSQHSKSKFEEVTMLESGRENVKTSNERCSDVDSFIAFLVNELKDAANKSVSSRQNLIFYQAVRGGNLFVVREVLKSLKNQGLHKELAWTVGCSLKGSPKQDHLTLYLHLRNILIVVFLLFIFVLINPFFYIIHATLKVTVDKYSGRLKDNIKVPLLLALLSEDKNMIKLFLEYGSCVSYSDDERNNIFHFLADMSLDGANKASTYHQMLEACITDVELLRNSYLNCRNQLNLTPFELTAKSGSIHFLVNLLNEIRFVKDPTIFVSPEKMIVQTDDCIFDIRNDPNEFETDLQQMYNNGGKTQVKCFDFPLGLYERGDSMGLQSYPLNLVCNRSITTLSEQDALTVITSEFMDSWMKLKQTKYIIYCYIGQIIPLFASILLFVYEHSLNGQSRDILYHFSNSFVNVTLNQTHCQYVLTNACGNQIYEETSHTTLTDHLLKGCRLCWIDNNEILQGIHYCPILLILIIMVTALFIFDVITRFVFVLNNINYREKKISKVVLPVISRLVPGSYAEKQMGLVMYILFLLSVILAMYTRTNAISQIEKCDAKTIDYLQAYDHIFMACRILFMFCLILRSMNSIHVLRLFPGIGFFIITTKRMTRDLFKFSILLIVSILAFAAIFRLIIHGPFQDPDNSTGMSKRFGTLHNSFFYTMMFSFGGGDDAPFARTLGSRLAYVTCSLFVVVMLMNLVIAIMTTTATYMYAKPYQKAVCKTEMWQEILGIEAQVLLILWPFKQLLKVLRLMVGSDRYMCRKKKQQKGKDINYESIRIVFVQNEQK